MHQVRSRSISRNNYDRLSRFYDLFSSGERSLSLGGIDLLNIQAGEHILEVGFGTGHILVHLASIVGELGRIYGIDLSPGMAKVASKRIDRSRLEDGISILVGDAAWLPYHGRCFDAVLMSFTLELFEESEIPTILAECLRVLKPGGKLCVVSLAKKERNSVRIYEWFHKHFSNIIDCRPIFGYPFLIDSGLKIIQVSEKSLWSLPVEITIARKPGDFSSF